MTQIVLASHNQKKLAELRRVLEPLVPGIEVVSYDGPEPVEDGLSFEANALIKARAAAKHTGLPAVADDSGISVDVLGGCPGIFSARWSGPERDDTKNLELLLWQLSDIAEPNRAARFVCAAALVMPDGEEVCELGNWAGDILTERAGTDGFGYDPIFRPAGESRSAAEMRPEEKDLVSHRNRAFTALAPAIAKRLISE
ncbi:RdgB/HAM1 family non-canonical purine NTP pyrophosphatase [Leucobacter sp. 1207-22]|uniref:RdgB/HAM1 family non-canonical purine NTP pyrophosphatase n=1 Tax=Leucobacter sp. 1207-22 TaxID=2604456 RepID=UPI0040648113